MTIVDIILWITKSKAIFWKPTFNYIVAQQFSVKRACEATRQENKKETKKKKKFCIPHGEPGR